CFFFQAEDGIRDFHVTGVQTCALPIFKAAFAKEGKKAEVELILSPAWSTDWISEEGLQKMEAYGIARPLSESHDKAVLLGGEKLVKCPQCKSTQTHLVSQFGSTPCKALFKCDDCHEPFDYFKCLK